MLGGRTSTAAAAATVAQSRRPTTTDTLVLHVLIKRGTSQCGGLPTFVVAMPPRGVEVRSTTTPPPIARGDAQGEEEATTVEGDGHDTPIASKGNFLAAMAETITTTTAIAIHTTITTTSSSNSLLMVTMGTAGTATARCSRNTR